MTFTPFSTLTSITRIRSRCSTRAARSGNGPSSALLHLYAKQCLIILSDLDSRGFFLGDENLDLALTSGVGSVRLLDTAGVIGTARSSTSGRALNILIDQQLHTILLRSLTPVITGCNRKGPLFVPVEDLAADTLV